MIDTPTYEHADDALMPWQHEIDTSSVAVVGNSGGLAGSECGEVIDAHGVVIRMNAAPTEGHENDVGSRTSLRFINGLLQQGKTLPYTTTPSAWLRELRSTRIALMPARSPRVAERARHMAHDSVTVHRCTDAFRAYMGRLEDVLGNPPSSGMHCLAIAAWMSDDVTLYGFGFHAEDLEDRHYWERWTDSSDASHSWERERRMTQALASAHGITVAEM